MITNNNYQHKQTSFGNAAVINGTMNYLATNQAIGATVVDLKSMVIPRTAIDFTRTPEAGMETARREVAACALYAAIGLFGLGAAYTILPFSNIKKYDIPVTKITAGSDTIEGFAQTWHKALAKGDLASTDGKGKVVDSYLDDIFKSISGVNGETKKAIDPELQKDIVKELKDLLMDEKGGYKIAKEKRATLTQKLINATGAGEHLHMDLPEKPISNSAENILDNAYSLGRTFMQEKVHNEFKTNGANNDFIKNLKRFNNKKMVLGLAAASAVALSMQAINRWMTKRKTGSDGFVAYKDKNGKVKKAEKDKSMGFFGMKIAASIGIMALALKSMIGFGKPEGEAATKAFWSRTKDELKKLPKKLEITKIMPNLNHYRLVYAATLVGRFMASSDKNELRESATRDFLGFTSWLILGDIAARSVAKYFEGKHKDITLLNYNNPKAKGLLNASLKTHAELLYASSKDTIGKSVTEASKIASANTNKALKYLNIAQASGYGISALLLGVTIPMLNKVITDRAAANDNAKEEAKAKKAA